MAVVESAVSFLVHKIRDSLADEIILLQGVEEQIEWVEKEFRRVECFLKDADGKIEMNERVKNWRQEVRDVAHFAEDAIDIFFLRIDYVRSATGCWGWFKRALFIFNELSACHQVASRVQRMKLQLASISESRATYGIEFSNSSNSAILDQYRGRLSTPQDGSYGSGQGEANDFVGFENELPDFIRQLTCNEQRRCVFSLVGMGGLGKTTLAAALYHNDLVKKHLDVRVWVTVSQQYDVKDIYRSVHKQLFKVENDGNQEQLRNEIVSLLSLKRFLVVLDDVWKKEVWDDLVVLFPDSNNGSRVVLTTRDKSVALHADLLSKPNELRLLKEDEGWKLLSKKAFWGKSPKENKLEAIGREIVKKCDFLPLAIVAIGGVLAGKDEEEWKRASKTISWQLGEGEAAISGILYMSYRDLPYELKPCFLYLSIFPEDHVFNAKKLIRLWAAEGLLQQQRGDATMEEVGKDYLKALAQRSLIRVEQSTSFGGGIKSFRVHDRLRDLSVSEAEEDRFSQVASLSSSSSRNIKARRLAIHCSSVEEYITSLRRRIAASAAELVRSVFVYPPGMEKLGAEQQKVVYHRFQLLRVLDLQKVRMEKVSNEIGRLIHLRYLGCTDTFLQNLPPSIANLRSLQTLACHSINPMEIPNSIDKLQHLKHLQLKSSAVFGYGGHEFQGQPRLELIDSLSTLTNLKVGKWVDVSLGKLCKLKKLGLSFDPQAHPTTDARIQFPQYCRSIAELESLHSLRLSITTAAFPKIQRQDIKIPPLEPLRRLVNLRKLSLHGPIEKLPDSPDHFPVNLTKLSLAYCDLGQEAFQTLSKLPNLCVLKLLRRSYVGKEMTCPPNGFPRLKYLLLEGLPDLEKLRIGQGAMPVLLRLNINLCKKLEMPPEGHEIKGLQVDVSNTADSDDENVFGAWNLLITVFQEFGRNRR